jgi:hypothetical protein
VTTAFSIAPIAYGQIWATHNGIEYRADHDGVRICTLDADGRPVASVLQTTDAAIALALTIQDAAVKATAGEVDDHGKRPSLTERMNRLNNAYKRAGR